MHLFQSPLPFSQSRIWQLQRDYFSSEGIAAWRSGEVPHYLTSNPVVGKTYAELVLAFLRDLSLKGQTKETVYLLELGAGPGRLCYHFLKHFEKYYSQSTIPLPPFCYVLSDFAEANLAFWKDHPRLQPFFSKGWLDFALFDAENSKEINLQKAKASIQTDSLAQPLLVIGNYFFDTIPQELFWVEDQRIAQCLLSLSTELDPSQIDTGSLLDALVLKFEYQDISPPVYKDEPLFHTMLETYRQELSNTHILFPHVGIRCIERLQQLSRQGLVLLTADKGKHRLQDLEGRRTPPQLSTHGSFSLMVNYHAFQMYCTLQGGLTLFPRHHHAHLDLGCLLFLPEANDYQETIQTYERFVNDFGPDDYFSLKKLVEKHFNTLSFQDTMATLRLSGYDARIFLQMLPRLFHLLPETSDSERWSLFQAVHRIWDTYYPLGERIDLAFELGNLLFAMTFYKEAIFYFELSTKIYEKNPGTLFNIALGHCLLGNFSTASPIVEEIRAFDPDHETLQELIKQFGKELKIS